MSTGDPNRKSKQTKRPSRAQQACPAQKYQGHRRTFRSRLPQPSHRPRIRHRQALGRQPPLRLHPRQRRPPPPHSSQMHRVDPRPRLRNPRHLQSRQRTRRLHQERHRLHRRPRRPSRHLVHHPRRDLHSRTHAAFLSPPQSEEDAPGRLPRSLAPAPIPGTSRKDRTPSRRRRFLNDDSAKHSVIPSEVG